MVWYFMLKSEVTEKYTRIVQDVYRGSETVVRCAVGVATGRKFLIFKHNCPE